MEERAAKHPSWRVYRALEKLGLDPADFGLRSDIKIFYAYKRTDELTMELISALSNPEYEDTAFPVLECLTLFRDVSGRQVLEGLLFDGRSIAEVCSLVDASEAFVSTYAALFYDMSVFANHMEKMVYAKEVTCGEDNFVKASLVDKGVEFFKAQNNIPSSKLSIDAIVTDSAVLAYQSMVKYAVDDATQEIAQGWGHVLVKMASVLSKKNSSSVSIKDFIVELQAAAPTTRSFDDLN